MSHFTLFSSFCFALAAIKPAWKPAYAAGIVAIFCQGYVGRYLSSPPLSRTRLAAVRWWCLNAPRGPSPDPDSIVSHLLFSQMLDGLPCKRSLRRWTPTALEGKEGCKAKGKGSPQSEPVSDIILYFVILHRASCANKHFHFALLAAQVGNIESGEWSAPTPIPTPLFYKFEQNKDSLPHQSFAKQVRPRPQSPATTPNLLSDTADDTVSAGSAIPPTKGGKWTHVDVNNMANEEDGATFSGQMVFCAILAFGACMSCVLPRANPHLPVTFASPEVGAVDVKESNTLNELYEIRAL